MISVASPIGLCQGHIVLLKVAWAHMDTGEEIAKFLTGRLKAVD